MQPISSFRQAMLAAAWAVGACSRSGIQEYPNRWPSPGTPWLLVVGLRPPQPVAGERVAELVRHDLMRRVRNLRIGIVDGSNLGNALEPMSSVRDTLSAATLAQLGALLHAAHVVTVAVEPTAAGLNVCAVVLTPRGRVAPDTVLRISVGDEQAAATAVVYTLRADPRWSSVLR